VEVSLAVNQLSAWVKMADDYVSPAPAFPIPNIYILLWYPFLILFGVYLERRTHWFSRFNIFTVFVVGMFVRYGVAVPFSDGILPSSSTHTPISTVELLSFYGALILTYIGIAAGVEVVYRWHARFPNPSYLASPAYAGTRALIVLAVAVMAVVALVWIVLPWRDFAAGLLQAGHLQQLAARLQRVTYGNATLYSNSALTYVGSFARFAIMPAVLWILYFHRGRSRIVHALFWVGLVALAVIGLASGQKTPELLLVIGFVIARLLLAGAPGIFNWKIASGAIAFVFGLVPALYHFQVPTWTYPQLVIATLYRFTIEYSRTAQLRFVFYPDLHPFLYGTSSFVVRTLARLVGIHVGGESPETYIPTHTAGVGAGYGGTWNAGFFADAWADFGWVGVIVAAVLVGVILAVIARWYEGSPKGPLQMGAYAAVCVSALYLSEVALLTASWTYGLLSSFLVYWMLGFLSARRQRFADPLEPDLPQQSVARTPLRKLLDAI
jgi:hypothetical protein